jgi:hypothetical protein
MKQGHRQWCERDRISGSFDENVTFRTPGARGQVNGF